MTNTSEAVEQVYYTVVPVQAVVTSYAIMTFNPYKCIQYTLVYQYTIINTSELISAH